MRSKTETTMERYYRVMAQSAEWYAKNICRNGTAEGFEMLALEWRAKQQAEAA
jgi:hypothetical protein